MRCCFLFLIFVFLACTKEKISPASLTVYPKPAINHISVYVNTNGSDNYKVVIPGTSVSREINPLSMTQASVSIDISQFKPGTYLIELYENDKLINYTDFIKL
jgi:hypothetical protein